MSDMLYPPEGRRGGQGVVSEKVQGSFQRAHAHGQRGFMKRVHTDTAGVSSVAPSYHCEPGFPFAAADVLVLFKQRTSSCRANKMQDRIAT